VNAIYILEDVLHDYTWLRSDRRVVDTDGPLACLRSRSRPRCAGEGCTPDGQYVAANGCHYPELFLALGGCGRSAWGVVHESTHRLSPQVALQVSAIDRLLLPCDLEYANSSNLAGWYGLLVNETYRFGTEGWGGHIVGLTIIYVNPLLASASHSGFYACPRRDGCHREVVIIYCFLQQACHTHGSVGSDIIPDTRLISTSLSDNKADRTALSQSRARYRSQTRTSFLAHCSYTTTL
ncbi:hypothetical protein WOLCODRAFT_139159, partial [Wolfiporia cocos MD-104 SS10]